MGKYDLLLGILTGAVIGPSIVIMSHVTKTVHPFVYSTISMAIAIPLLVILAHFFSGEGLKGIFSQGRRDFLTVWFERFIIASGILFTFGVSLTLAIRSVFLVQLEPAFVFAWSILLLKEKARKSKLFMIATLIVGAFLVTTGGNLNVFESVMLGDLLIIIALVMLSHSYLVSAKLMKYSNPIKLYFGFALCSLPVFFVLTLIFLPFSAFAVSEYNLALIASASLLFNVIGFPLWLICLKRLKPWVLASSLIVQTIAGAALSFFWLGQSLSLIQAIGGAIVLISVYLIGTREQT
jgi:drug/metabolite transporter (DMT)-like permease